MRTIPIAALLVTIASMAPRPVHAQAPGARRLQLAFEADQRVTLSAQYVTVAEILGEWARRCGCYVVNANRLTGAPLVVPIRFEHATQAEVLESLLRQAAGYVLTPSRSAGSASNYETIYIVPTSNASAIAAPAFSGSYGSAVAVPIATTGSPADEIPPVVPERQPEAAPQAPPPPPTPPVRTGSAGVSVPLTTVTPFGSNPQPQAPAPSQGGGATPGR